MTEEYEMVSKTELAGLRERSASIQRLVDEQALDEALWSTPVDRLQTFQEAYLQVQLRTLHAIIEGDVDMANELK